jgi:hypothetical protein
MLYIMRGPLREIFTTLYIPEPLDLLLARESVEEKENYSYIRKDAHPVIRASKGLAHFP